MMKRLLFAAALVAALAACSSKNGDSGGAPQGSLTKEQLLDPATCKSCHETEYAQWASSMHAYAADDPVFLAMNARAQRETNGALGDFCIKCHAPMAVRLGMTTDGLNAADLPPRVKGVTCFFCHSVDAVEGTHDAPLHLADDGMMRGPIADPIASTPHLAGYSKLHDREVIDSAPLCGSCHDIQTPMGVATAQTFAEWKTTIYSHDVAGVRLTCGSCHMKGSMGQAATVPGAPTRLIHDHSWPGVDVALTPFPDTDAQRAAVQAELDSSINVKLCVTPPKDGANVQVTLDNAFVGHGFPSGAGYDRRVWVEVTASKDGGKVFGSGDVPDSVSPTSLDPATVWMFRTALFDANGSELHFQWDAASATPSFVPPAVTTDPKDPAYYHAITRGWLVPGEFDTVHVRVRVSPVDAAVASDLVASGDLDPAIAAAIPSYELTGSKLTWTSDMGFTCLP